MLIASRVVGVKCVPVNVRVTGPEFTGREAGDKAVNVGTGGAADIVNTLALDVPPADAPLETVTGTLAAVAICAAVICAVNRVAESKVVGTARPFHSTLDEAAKLVPVMSN